MNITVERSDGASIPLGCGAGWSILSDGLGEFGLVSQDVSTSANVLTDGSSLVSKRVPEIDRTISAVYTGKNADAARAEMLSFLNPKHSFKVHVTYRGRTRWFEGELIKSEVSVGNVNAKPTVTFTILSVDPYMRSTSHNEAAFGDSTPMLGWPFVSHTLEPWPDGTKKAPGFLFSELVYDGLNTIYNDGDVQTYYTVRIEADAELRNPTINKDGKFVKVETVMNSGDVLVIDFESAPPKVEMNGTNVIGNTSRDSNFTGMQMQVGANTFSFTVDNMENRSLAKVQVLFWRKYLGI